MSLIPCDSLDPDDLRHWRRMELQDAAWASTHRLRHLAAGSIRSIEEFAQRGPCYASVSWGKDSTVLAHLVWAIAESGGPVIPIAWFREEPATNPHCYTVRDAFLDRHRHPYIETAVWLNWNAIEGRFDENDIDERRTEQEPILRSNFNDSKKREEGRRSDQRRWWSAWWQEAQVGRIATIPKLDPDDEIWSVGRLTGMRGEESARRRRRMSLGPTVGSSCCPLGLWMARDVFAYLYAHDLPVHPAYAMSFGGRLDRDTLRVSLIGGDQGRGFGRGEWEQRYYPDVIARMRSTSS